MTPRNVHIDCTVSGMNPLAALKSHLRNMKLGEIIAIESFTAPCGTPLPGYVVQAMFDRVFDNRVWATWDHETHSSKAVYALYMDDVQDTEHEYG